MDNNYTSKFVYSGEGAAVSFDHSVSYIDFANSVRDRFPVLGRSIVNLRYTVFPDVVSYRLENEDDMKMMFRVLARYSSDFVDVDICSFDVSASGFESVLSNNVSEESSVLFDENDYLGCYKLKEAKSCHDVVRLQTNKMMGSKIIKSIMLDKVRENPNKKAIDIYHEIKSNYEMDLVCFGQEAVESNPGSTIKIEYEPETRKFERMFVCYNAWMKIFQFCRPILFIDVTFISNKYRGQLISASAKDANQDGVDLTAASI
ncbi:hypothetical protein ACLB2K_031672 [Fragaria x ananassa]